MGEAERVVSDVVPAPPEVVRAFYVDLDNLTLLHPFLVSVRTVSRSAKPSGYQQTYLIRENIPVGPIQLPIRFVAELDVPDTGDVVALSRQFPRIVLRTVTSFESDGAQTNIVERIRFTAPRPLAAKVVREGCRAHAEMLAGMRKHFQ